MCSSRHPAASAFCYLLSDHPSRGLTRRRTVTDLHYTDGQWQPIDILAECPDGAGVDDYLKSLGWEEFLSVGAPGESFMAIKTYIRRARDGASTQYLLSVDDVNLVSPYVLVDTFPELMDLIARWAPAVQAAQITGFLEDLMQLRLDRNGYAEMLAARVKFGLDDIYSQGRRELHDREEASRRRRQQLREQRAAGRDS
jgi:hypothetical protein